MCLESGFGRCPDQKILSGLQRLAARHHEIRRFGPASPTKGTAENFLPMATVIHCRSAYSHHGNNTHFIAIAHVEVAYFISIKRSSLLFGIVYGALLFGERRLLRHLFAGTVMLIGMSLIVIS